MSCRSKYKKLSMGLIISSIGIEDQM